MNNPEDTGEDFLFDVNSLPSLFDDGVQDHDSDWNLLPDGPDDGNDDTDLYYPQNDDLFSLLRSDDLAREFDASSDVLDDVSWPEAVEPTTASNIISTGRSPFVFPRPSIRYAIENILEGVSRAVLSGEDDVKIVLCPHDVPQDSLDDHTWLDERTKTVSFPGKNAEEAWRFTVILRILDLIREALKKGTIITKRDIYYFDPALFGNQPVVDRYIDIITSCFHVRRSELNVTAAAKGLMLGPIVITKNDGSQLDLSQANDPVLIHGSHDVSCIEMSPAQWILIVEKEATFQSLISSRIGQSLRLQGVVMTGKGYPDLASREMLHSLSTTATKNSYECPRIYGLVDYDPDGIAILSVYRHGSANLAYRQEALAVGSISRLGLTRHHISDADRPHHAQNLLPLTKRDRNKAANMLNKSHCNEDEEDNETRSELQIMLMLNYKAELQILDEHDWQTMLQELIL